ncbi:hypothetical protein RHSIM_Rhsim01G0016300 [Rhododendron simsii]|uniref:ARM repeat superfamily protein n=1 Tax=Rhododendron simsii TaxID=118357 RepID=A0A834HHC2_RHOSS|nr:hypothetical protein RHSIM_Rhsim01G0016300 [Rhododendron simsii]
MAKNPMAIPQAILELQHPSMRESALRCLSDFLIWKREEDRENYDWTALLLFNSCSTMAVLLQEVLAFSQLSADGTPTVRASKRVVNVLTLFQCIASSKQTRYKFVKSFIPNFVVPLIRFEIPLENYEDVRAVALSVIGILCQAREPEVIQWALDSNMVEICQISMEIGSELSKVVRLFFKETKGVILDVRNLQLSSLEALVILPQKSSSINDNPIGMHILEAILQDDSGMSYICSPTCDQLLKNLIRTWEHLVACLAADQDFSPRLLFHILRCYILLCTNARGFSTVRENLPDSLTDSSFVDLTEEFPLIASLLQQLLLSLGKVDNCSLSFKPDDLQLY